MRKLLMSAHEYLNELTLYSFFHNNDNRGSSAKLTNVKQKDDVYIHMMNHEESIEQVSHQSLNSK